MTAPTSEFVAGLRELADWYERHPDAPIDRTPRFALVFLGDEGDQLVEFARALADGAPKGAVRKEVEDHYFHVRRSFGPIEVDALTFRSVVCERRVVAVEEVEVEEPDPDAVAALPKVKRTEQREVVEWTCPESLLDGADRKSVDAPGPDYEPVAI